MSYLEGYTQGKKEGIAEGRKLAAKAIEEHRDSERWSEPYMLAMDEAAEIAAGKEQK